MSGHDDQITSVVTAFEQKARNLDIRVIEVGRPCSLFFGIEFEQHPIGAPLMKVFGSLVRP